MHLACPVNKWASARLSDKKKIEREFCSYLFNKFYINPFLSSKNHRYLARVLGKDTVSRVNTGNLNYSIFFFFFFSFHHVSLRFCLISLFFPFISFWFDLSVYFFSCRSNILLGMVLYAFFFSVFNRRTCFLRWSWNLSWNQRVWDLNLFWY